MHDNHTSIQHRVFTLSTLWVWKRKSQSLHFSPKTGHGHGAIWPCPSSQSGEVQIFISNKPSGDTHTD